jgi:hypothetical protein
MAAWPDADRRSRLVFIVDGLDRSAIERSLLAFLTPARGEGALVRPRKGPSLRSG